MASPPSKTAKPAKPATADKAAKPARAKPATAAALHDDEDSASPSGKGPAAATNILRLKDLVNAVAAASGQKKPAAKQAVEATLAAMANALAAKTTLVVPPLGKLRVVKSQADSLTLKLRFQGSPTIAAKPLAEDAEDD